MPRRKALKKPLFYFEPLTSWDTLAIWAYGLTTIIFILYIYLGPDKTKITFLIFYVTSLQLLNYLLNYTLLRNLRSYFIWCVFGIIHICLYFFLRSSHFYDGARGLLLNTIVLLFLYQILRIISLKIQKQELAMPTKDYKDLFGNRQVTFLDFVLFMIYYGSFYGLTILAVSHSY
jgi:hypothetical protein